MPSSNTHASANPSSKPKAFTKDHIEHVPLFLLATFQHHSFYLSLIHVTPKGLPPTMTLHSYTSCPPTTIKLLLIHSQTSKFAYVDKISYHHSYPLPIHPISTRSACTRGQTISILFLHLEISLPSLFLFLLLPQPSILLYSL